MMNIHKPVLLNEVVEWLNIRPGAKIIDATLNGGGHSIEILEKYPDIEILGIEWDPDIFQEFQNSEISKKVKAVNDSYVNLKKIVEQNDFHPDGIVFDLGLSSWHYESSGRGFSFKRDEILDMRFNPSASSGQVLTAADIVNSYEPGELERIIAEYGEEKFAGQIAKAIVRARKQRPIIKTLDLVKAIESAVPEGYKKRKIHFATKTFQALRIEVNDELGNVRAGVEAAIEALNPCGRLVVISFQGLEDKIVKEIFREKSKAGVVTLPYKGTIKPKWEEVRENPRARSAKMKTAEKV